MIHTVYRFALVTVFCAGLGAGLGCNNDDDDGDVEVASPAEVMAACQAYCDKSKICDADTAVDECINKCKNNLGNCMVDEQAEAVADVNNCAGKACDEFTGCTIGAGFQCAFGL